MVAKKITVTLRPATAASKKKWTAVIDGTRTVHFGAAGYSDFTIHKDEERRQRYVARHAAREDWTIAGVGTAGFWSRWLLWNQPTINSSIADMHRRFPRLEIIKS